MDEKELPAEVSDITGPDILTDENGKKIRPFSRKIHLLHTQVNGTMYVRYIRKRAGKLKKGDQLKLVMEPDNKFDYMAILVKNEKGQKLGYIPQRANEILFNLMDAGKTVYAVVCGGTIGKSAFDKKADFIDILIDVYMYD